MSLPDWDYRPEWLITVRGDQEFDGPEHALSEAIDLAVELYAELIRSELSTMRVTWTGGTWQRVGPDVDRLEREAEAGRRLRERVEQWWMGDEVDATQEANDEIWLDILTGYDREVSE